MATQGSKLEKSIDLEYPRAAWKEISQETLPGAATSNSLREVELGELDTNSLGLRETAKDETNQKIHNKSTNVALSRGREPIGKNATKDEDASPPTQRIREFPEKGIQAQAKRAQKLPQEEKTVLLDKIAQCPATPFQKRVLIALLDIPRGQYTTYGILAKHLSSSARAVGNGLRNNPLAPDVPCHRVLATGGGIGGFKGSWGRKGMKGLNDVEKRGLLRAEGVRFDGVGRVIGRPWEGFG